MYLQRSVITEYFVARMRGRDRVILSEYYVLSPLHVTRRSFLNTSAHNFVLNRLLKSPVDSFPAGGRELLLDVTCEFIDVIYGKF